jgi:Uma2 family endonuclease
MTQSLQTQMSFEQFLEWKPETSRYELHHGVAIEMQPTGRHEEITGFLALELVLEFRRLNLPYFCPKQALVQSLNRDSAYCPDVLVVNRDALSKEPLWERHSTLTEGSSIPLAIEVVSTNWRDDYLTKLRDYEELEISEYWIVDYSALGGTRYIGTPEQATISIYYLVEGEYRVMQFRESDRLDSPSFPELELTANLVFSAGL